MIYTQDHEPSHSHCWKVGGEVVINLVVLGVNKTSATKKHKDHKKEPAGRPTTLALNAFSFM